MQRWFIRDLEENVPLTGQQQKQLQEITTKLHQEAMEQFRNNRPSRETWQAMRQLRQEQQQAAEAGDEAKVQEIQKQLEDSGPAGMFRQMRSHAMDEVGKILTADQEEAFRQWRALRESNLPPPLASDPEALKNSIKDISTLTDLQRDSLEAAFGRYSDRIDGVPTDDVVDRNKLRNELISRVQNILKPSQRVLMTTTFRRQMMQRFQAGRQRNRQNSSASQPGSPEAASTGSGAGSDTTATSSTVEQSADEQTASQTPPAATVDPLNVDEWVTYVRTFVDQNSLDEMATETAFGILQELRTRRDIYLSSHRQDAAEFDRKAKLAESPEQLALIEQDRKALQQPVADMFQELKDRLDTLLPASQVRPASQASPGPAATSQPAPTMRAASTRAARRR